MSWQSAEFRTHTKKKKKTALGNNVVVEAVEVAVDGREVRDGTLLRDPRDEAVDPGRERGLEIGRDIIFFLWNVGLLEDLDHLDQTQQASSHSSQQRTRGFKISSSKRPWGSAQGSALRFNDHPNGPVSIRDRRDEKGTHVAGGHVCDQEPLRPGTP